LGKNQYKQWFYENPSYCRGDFSAFLKKEGYSGLIAQESPDWDFQQAAFVYVLFEDNGLKPLAEKTL
jgi:hypothetical protein